MPVMPLLVARDEGHIVGLGLVRRDRAAGGVVGVVGDRVGVGFPFCIEGVARIDGVICPHVIMRAGAIVSGVPAVEGVTRARQ